MTEMDFLFLWPEKFNVNNISTHYLALLDDAGLLQNKYIDNLL